MSLVSWSFASDKLEMWGWVFVSDFQFSLGCIWSWLMVPPWVSGPPHERPMSGVSWYMGHIWLKLAKSSRSSAHLTSDWLVMWLYDDSAVKKHWKKAFKALTLQTRRQAEAAKRNSTSDVWITLLFSALAFSTFPSFPSSSLHQRERSAGFSH